MFRHLLESAALELVPERELKRSENGTVILIRDRDTGERMIYREFTGSPEAYQKLRTLRSAHLPRVYAVAAREGKVSSLEEYIGGDSLAAVLEGGTLPQDQARQIALQLCKALKELHSVGVVHRDIKPENILLRGDEAVLIDFDASRLTKPEHNTDTQIMGTTGYAAPEQYGFSQTDARADIYALGILLNEMLTGQHPAKRLAEGDLRPVIEKCIEVNVDKRYASVEELIRALTPQARKRNRGIAAAAAVVLAGAAFGLGFFLAPRQAAPETMETMPSETMPPETTGPAVEVLRHDPLVVPEERKTGITAPYTSTFLYDLDGDGEKEEYQFGVLIDGLPDLPFIVTSDSVHPYDETVTTQHRTVYPCVWRTLEDGSVEKVYEFAELLEEPQTNLWRLTNEGSAAPSVMTHDGRWKGGLIVEFTFEQHLGKWLYEVSAKLEGIELTAQAMTTLLAENPEG